MPWGRWLTLRFTLIAIVMLLVCAMPTVGQAQGADDLPALQHQVGRLYNQGKYGEAMPLARRYVVVARQKHGEEHAEFATAIAWLANVYRAQGRTAEAEPLYQRALAIRERALGPEHPDVATSLDSLAGLYRSKGECTCLP